MDEHPFKHLIAKKYDIVMINDYSELDYDLPIVELVNSYEECILLGWSMGVLAGQQLFADKKDIFQKLIALNGTLQPISDAYGIPVDTFQATFNNFNEATRLKFYKRMCKEKLLLKKFLRTKPKRDLDDQREELAQLLKRKTIFLPEDSIYTEVIITLHDYIIPTENQKRFWNNMNINLIEGSHFPFYSWESWDELVETLAPM